MLETPKASPPSHGTDGEDDLSFMYASGEMDNQQERTVSLDFIAGLVVGEGSFILGASRIAKRKGNLRITPAFYIQMNDRRTMEIVGNSLTSLGISHWGPKWDESRGRSVIQVNGTKRVLRFIESLSPYLTGTKAEAADIVRRFATSRLEAPSGAPYTAEELALVNELRSVNGIKGKHTNRIAL